MLWRIIKAKNYCETEGDLLKSYKVMGYVPKNTFLRLALGVHP
jgi:hypothetical protein